MASDYPLKIFYDASCRVCALEMDQLVARDTAGRPVLVDKPAPGFDAAYRVFARHRKSISKALAPAIHALRDRRERKEAS